MIEARTFEQTEQESESANTEVAVYDEDGKELWRGPAIGVDETPAGSLSVRRIVVVDGHQMTMEVARLKNWGRVEYEGCAFDLESVARQEEDMRRAQAANRAQIEAAENQAKEMERATAAARFGLGGGPVPLNREGRRHPGN